MDNENRLKLRSITFRVTEGTEELYHEVFKDIFKGMYGPDHKQYSLRVSGIMAYATCKLNVLLNDADFFALKTKVINTIELNNLKFETEEFGNE